MPEGSRERKEAEREKVCYKRSEKTETRLPERWMQRDGGQRGGQVAGRQCTLAIHSHCGRHMALSPPSGPQRQSRLSVGRLQAAPGSPTSGRPPRGLAELSRGWAGGWLGRGTGLDTGPAFPSRGGLPGAAQVWSLQNSLLPSILCRRGWAGSGFLEVWNVHIGPQKASSGPQPNPAP